MPPFHHGATELPTDYTFTGQREAAEIGLKYYVARWYDSEIGHFIQADSIVPDAANPLAWNRYAYIFYKPLNYYDPIGHIGKTTPNQNYMVSDSGGTTNQIIQVDLANHESVNQMDPCFVNDLGLGYNGCPFMASRMSISTIEDMARIFWENYGTENDIGYSPDSGMQPRDLASFLGDYYGEENVIENIRWDLDGISYALANGNIVVVDIQVLSNYSSLASDDGIAHFARVLGIDWDREVVYLENSLGGVQWEASFDLFEKSWFDPENRSHRPADNAQFVINWGVEIIP